MAPAGYPSIPQTVTVADTLANIAPALGNVAGFRVWLVDCLSGVKYGPSTVTDSGGNWTLAGVPASASYDVFYGPDANNYSKAGSSPYVVGIALLNAPSQQFTGYLRESATVAVTAFNGGGQAGATALAAMFNRVTTSVAAVAPFDSVLLPPSLTGLDVVVVNATNNPIQVFGSGTDTINGQAAATGLTQAPNSVEVYFCTAAGIWNVDPGIGFSGQLFTELAQDNVVANPGGGQAGATQLWAQTSRIGTVATAGDSIKLPASAPGLELLVINHGLNSMQVYGFGTDTIDDVAAATGVSQMVNSMVIYTCATAGKWYSNGIGTGFAGQFPTVSFANAITAKAGGGQSSGTPLASVLNRVTVIATTNDSVTLPVSFGGMQITVINAHATNSLNVFPNTGEMINALGANAAFALAATKTATFYCTVAGQWHTILSA